MPGGEEIFEIEMEKITAKSEENGVVLEPKEVSHVLKKGFDASDYHFRYSGQPQFHVNVDSSNLSYFMKIQRLLKK